MKQKFNSLRNLYNEKLYELERNKLLNDRIQSLENELEGIDYELQVSKVYRNALLKILDCTKDKYANYQSSRLNYIEDSLSDVINLLFPDAELTPKIKTFDRRNIMRSELILMDKGNNVRYPRITEGGFMKQLIGFVSAIRVIQLIGAKTLFMDEAFSNASTKKKEQVAAVINEYLKEGLQLILISQSPECYDTLPRREFRLNTVNGVCVLKDVRDCEGEI